VARGFLSLAVALSRGEGLGELEMHRHARSALGALACLLIVVSSVARAGDPADDGPHAVSSTRLDLVTGGKKTYLELELPKDATAPCPVVLICPGWAADPSNFEKISSHLASRGFAVATLKQPDNWGNDTAQWAGCLKDALDELEKRAAPDSGSVAAGKLDMKRLALLGHSYGGAAVVWEAASDPRVQCVIALAPVNQPNRATLLEHAAQATAPLLVVAGDSDWLATNKTYTRAIYDRASGAAHREYVQVKGGDHNFYTGSGDRSKLASRYYTAFLERFLGVAADPGGFTDGTQATADEKARKLSASAAGEAPPPPSAPSRTPGVAGALGHSER
jgi:predicted dienelactone hydrolase